MEESDAALVEAARSGDEDAFARLVDRYLERCWNVAWRILHDRDRAADVAQEAMTAAWQQLDTLSSPGSFGGWVLRISRNRALNRLEHERRAVPVDEDRHLEPTDRLVMAAGPEERHERNEAADLVWGAAAALGERDASVLDLHLRHGLEPGELAEELGVTPNNAHQVVFRLRNRLGGAIRAYVLWNHGDPRCDELARLLSTKGATSFGPATMRAIERHASDCATCERDRDSVLAPAALFGAVPLAAMPAELRDRALGALSDAGVPTPERSTTPDGDGGDHEVGPDGGRGGAPEGDPTDATAPLALAGVGSVPALQRRPLVLGASVAAVLVFAIVVLLARGPGEADEPVDVAGASTTTEAPVSTTTSSATAAITVDDPGEGVGDDGTTTLPTAPVSPPVGEPADEITPPKSVPAPSEPGPTPGPVLPPTSPPTDPTTAPPRIVRFEMTPFGIVATPECSVGHRIIWATSGATHAVLSVDGEAAEPVPLEGEHVVCTAASTATLIVIGAGGVDSQTSSPR